MSRKKCDLVLLLSGGLDSALLLDIALSQNKEPLCLLIDYGQKHVAELNFARSLVLEKGVAHQLIQIEDFAISSKLTDGIVKYPGVSEWHVPSRNLIFISLAVSLAESNGINTVWYGANYEDREHLFPDCYQEWVYSLNKLLEINGSMKVQVEAPLLGMQKDTIRQLAKHFGINNDKIFSGYGEEK
jgi:7-cyano-7-deazaguanine synthase